MGHTHSVKDTDVYFEIDAITRKILAKSGKSALIQGDHNSERFTFRLPRWVEDHDMEQCNTVQVHFINIGSTAGEQSKDVYDVDDVQADPEDEDYISLTWLISNNATKYAGKMSFLIKFKCVTDGVVDYVWNTAIYEGISVSAGMDNGEAIATEYSDILAEWEQRINDFEESGGASDEQIAAAVKKYLDENPVKVGSTATIGVVELLANKWEGSENLYSQRVTIDGVTENSQVDLTPSVEQLVVFYEKDLTFVTENEGGTVTVYAIGQKPTHDYTIQVTITEVEL